MGCIDEVLEFYSFSIFFVLSWSQRYATRTTTATITGSTSAQDSHFHGIVHEL